MRRAFATRWQGPSRMTTAQAAAYLGLAPATVQRLSQEFATSGGRAGLQRAGKGARFFLGQDVHLFALRRAAAAHIRPILESIRRYAHARGVLLTPITLNFHCLTVAADHIRNSRFFAHAFHHQWAGPKSICMAPEIGLEPLATAAGITLHEVGHVMVDDHIEVSAEPAADQWVRERLGLEIHYSPKTTVQYLDRPAMRALGLA